jgi:hypothetical protein
MSSGAWGVGGGEGVGGLNVRIEVNSYT